MKLNEFKPGVAFNVLIKGDPGTGKTPLACSFPYPILLFDCDYRARALNLFFNRDPERLNNIEVVQPKTFEDVKRELEKMYNSRSQKYKTIVLDPLTTFADMTMRSLIQMKGESNRKIGSVTIAGIQDYGDESAILTEVITLLRLMYQTHNVNTILVAHVVSSEEKDLKKNVTATSRSLLTGGKKVGSKIPSYFDEVWHTSVRPGFDGRPEFVCQTRHTGYDFARTGLDIPDEINFTNYEKDPAKYFYELVKGSIPDVDVYKTAIAEEDKIVRQTEIVEESNGVVYERPITFKK